MPVAFVTGGSGFVGRNLIPALIERGYQVRALARSEQAIQTVKNLGAQAVKGDLSMVELIYEAMQDCQLVCHSAAHLGDWGKYKDFYRDNVKGTENVLEAAQTAKVEKFVHVGTEAVLVGGPPIIRVNETQPIPLEPQGLYPATKALAEQRVLAANTASFTTIVVRPRLIWGKDDTTILPKLVESVRSGQFKWIDGGHYLTSTCHVTNVCEGIILAAEKGRGGQVYFLTDGQPIEVREFFTKMLKTQGITSESGSIPGWLAMAIAQLIEFFWTTYELTGQPPVTVTALRLIGTEVTVDDTKARKELGYKGLVSLEAGLAGMSRF